MRLLKPILGVVLCVSILINVVLIYKVRGKRAIITVNGEPITRTEMDGYLEQAYGANYKATMVQRILVDQEAHAQGVAPTDAEILEAYDERKELDWAYAQKLTRQPWLADEAKNELKLAYEEEHLLAKGIPVTDEEVKDEYSHNPQLYDTPNKAKCTVAVILNESRTDAVKAMLLDPKYTPNAIAANYPREVTFLGDNYHYTFAQPFGTDRFDAIFKMEPRSVREEPPAELASLGARKVLVRLDETTKGKVADLTDPRVINKIKLNVQRHRARPASELLSSLWQKANIVFDDPADRTNTEMFFFPDRARTESK